MARIIETSADQDVIRIFARNGKWAHWDGASAYHSALGKYQNIMLHGRLRIWPLCGARSARNISRLARICIKLALKISCMRASALKINRDIARRYRRRVGRAHKMKKGSDISNKTSRIYQEKGYQACIEGMNISGKKQYARTNDKQGEHRIWYHEGIRRHDIYQGKEQKAYEE